MYHGWKLGIGKYIDYIINSLESDKYLEKFKNFVDHLLLQDVWFAWFSNFLLHASH